MSADVSKDGTRDQAEKPFRSGFVVVAGRPNVGKSTLVNRLVGRKVSIVSDKPQTTRNRVAGVVTGLSSQIVLLDIPGFQKPRDELTTRMQSAVDDTLGEADGALFVLSADEAIGKGDAFIASRLQTVGVPTVAVVNKGDLVSAERARRQLLRTAELGSFRGVTLISAETGLGVTELLPSLEDLLPEGPKYYPDEVLTDRPEEWLVGELVREKVLAATEEEIPHSVSVEVLDMEPRADCDLVDIRVAVYVERASQRPIILGHGGQKIKQIGSEARRDIEALLGVHVYLELVVQVRRHWRRNPGFLGRLGL